MIPLPPKGDPRRPMYVAVRSMRLLGIVLVTIGGLGAFTTLARMILWRGSPMRASSPLPILTTLMGTFFYLAPGVLLLVFASKIVRRKAWALISAIVLISIMLLLLMMVPVIFTIIAFTDGWSPFYLIPIGIDAVFVVALAQLVYLLSKSFQALTYFAPEESRGFEPIAVLVQRTDGTLNQS